MESPTEIVAEPIAAQSSVVALELSPPINEDQTLSAAPIESGIAARRPASELLQRPLVKSADSALEVVETPEISARMGEYMQPWLRSIVTLWCVGVVLFSVRPILSWLTVRRLRTVGVLPVSDAVRLALQNVQSRLKVAQRVQVLQSTVVNSPMVIGCFHSVILLPMGFLSAAPISQLEAILAHELAHVRRYDYLVNLLQTAIETLFFYHPAVWWLSNCIRVERENCCDDIVVAELGDRVAYGRALLAVDELRAQAATLALSARGGSLVARVKRLLDNKHSAGNRTGAGFVGLGLIATGIMLAIAGTSVGVNASRGNIEPPAPIVATLLNGATVELRGRGEFPPLAERQLVGRRPH